MAKRVYFSVILILLCKILFAQTSAIPNTRFDTLHSNILNEDRQLIIYMPPGANGHERHYPVMYLFDAEGQFAKTIGVLDHLSNTIGNEKCPQMIVVGIFHRNRFSDLIPPLKSNNPPQMDLFPDFLTKELIPYIDKKYPTQPFRVLLGHSLGGLRVVHTFIFNPNLFDSYIALDPSLGHVNGWIDEAIETFDKSSYANKSLYVAMGHTMPLGMDTQAISLDTTGASRHMRRIMTFSNYAKAKEKNDFSFHWKYYPSESHQSVVFMGTYDGLIENFRWFVNEKLYDIFKSEVSPETSVKIIEDYYIRITQKFAYPNNPTEEGTRSLIDYLTYKQWFDKAYAFAQYNVKKYPNSVLAKQQLEQAYWNTKMSIDSLYSSKKMKDFLTSCKLEFSHKNPKYNVSEMAINTLGYKLIQQKKLEEAASVFKLNTELYPKSSNVYDSYGECLLLLNKKEEGLMAYKKSLQLDPENNNAKKIIESLESHK